MEDNFLVCDICASKHENMEALRNHLEGHANYIYGVDDDNDEKEIITARKIIPRSFKCTHPKCRRGFHNQKGVRHHLIVAHGVRKPPMETIYNCPECDFKTKYQLSIRNHIKNKSCQRIKPIVSREEWHQRMENKDKKDQRCIFCNYIAANRYSLVTHLEAHLRKEDRPEFECTVCHLSFPAYSRAQKHVKQFHSND